MGQTWSELGQPLVALPLHHRARGILEGNGEDSEDDLAFTLMLIGQAHLEAGDPVTALPWLEESLAMHERIDAKPAYLADAQFPLARALWLVPAQRGRAIQLAEQARDALAAAGGGQRRLAG